MTLHPHFGISNATYVELNKLSKYIFTINLRYKVMCTIAAMVAAYSCAVCAAAAMCGGRGLKRAHNEVEKASSVWIRPEGTWLIHQAHTLYCSCDCSEENMLALLTRCAIIFINSCQESTFCTGTSQVCYCTQLMECVLAGECGFKIDHTQLCFQPHMH